MLRVADVSQTAITALLQRFDLCLVRQQPHSEIAGSFWGDSEAGIIGRTVFARDDTPVHSLLHETCHIICMTSERREGLQCNAGGDDLEEAAVCYLQLVLADEIDTVGSRRLMHDMDDWGYSFRLGSTRDWFENDAEDAVEFLINHGLLSAAAKLTFELRR